MMAEHQNTDTNTIGVPAPKKPKMSESDVLVGLLDLPDELNEISDTSFLGGGGAAPPTNNIDQHSLDINPLQNSLTSNQQLTGPPPNMNSLAPPVNTGTPPPNIGLSPHQLQNMMGGSATPSPNAGISTSGDPTPTLPSVSASPTHAVSVPPPTMPNMGMGGGNIPINHPYQPHPQHPHMNNMYQSRMATAHSGMSPPTIDSRFAASPYANHQGLPPSRHYAPHPNMAAMGGGLAHHPHRMPPPTHQYSSHHHSMPHPSTLSPHTLNSMGTDHHGFPPVIPPQHNMYSTPGPRPQAGMLHMGGVGNQPLSDISTNPHQNPLMGPPPGPTPNTGIPPSSNPSTASNDPEKRKLIQQQLVLLLHAHRCQQREKEHVTHGGGYRPCTLPHCRTMKNVLNHMTECQAGRDCNFPHCASSRQIIYHWKSCTQQECPVCLPLKTSALKSNIQAASGGGPLPPAIPPVGTNTFATSTVGVGIGSNPSVPTPNSNQQPPTGQGLMSTNVYSPTPSMQPNMKPDQPNSGLMRPVIGWHAEVNSDLRNHLIKKLVEAIYPIPISDQNPQDQRVNSLFQYAVRVEKAMFESAISRDDYYQKLAEKIYRIRKELDEKRKIKKGVNGTVDDPSCMNTPNSNNPNLPLGSPGDIPSNPSIALPPTPLSDSGKAEFIRSIIGPIPYSISSKPLPTTSSILASIKSETTPTLADSLHTDSCSYGVAPPPVSLDKKDAIDIKIESIENNIEAVGSIPPPITPHTPLDNSVPSIKQKLMRRDSVTDPSYVSQTTPIAASPIPSESKKLNRSSARIKVDPSLIKTFSPDEIEYALRPVFNAVWNQDPEALPFHKPVEPISLGIPDYFDIIKNPIDLSAIDMKLRQGEYNNPWEFCDDMQLMFDNAWTYNKKTSRVYKFCSKLAEVYSETIDEAMRYLGYCCGQKYMFHPQVLYCYGKLCPIPRDSPYYGCHNNRYVYCTKCFQEIPGESIAVSDDGTNTTSLPKVAFKEMKNDSVGLEPFVECVHCKRSFHKICVLYHEPIWPEGFQCNNCLSILNSGRRENKFVAKRLPTTKLGSFLEERVNTFLRQAGTDAEVTIRVVSSSNKFLDTRLGMVDRFSYFPNQFPYRTKALFVFEEIDGAEVCFFGMHVQEYGSDCPAPNTRRVYISYLDSVHFFRPKQYRTLVYHEILIGYLEFCKQNGFQTAHIWACPPGEGDDYIFHCHPIEQKIPKPKRLVEWYRNMLERGQEHNVISGYQDIFQYCTEAEITTVTDIPYFEGDFWPNVIEETIKELDQEEEERKASEASVDQQRPGSKKAGKRGTNKKGSKKAASRTKIGKKPNPLVSGDDLTQKIYQTMEKHKEVFFVVFLQPPTIASPLPVTTDPDSLVTCELMDGRDAFLNLAREKHWEFSSLRRAKYSTMSMLYELFNQGDRFVYTCNNCHTDVEFRYHCTECEDFDLCENCFKTVRHEHQMEKLGFNMGDDIKTSSQNTILTREQQNKRRNEFLIHACQCRDPTCAKPLCIKMKQLLRHARDCKMRSSGKCTACNFFIRICVMHAQECREIKCPVPICPNLKQKMRERRQREQKRSYELARRRMRKMNQQASPTAATSNEETPTTATPKPAPSPATPQPMTAPTSGKAGAIGSPNPHTPSQATPTTIPASPAGPLTNPSTPFVPATPQNKPPVESGAPNIVVQQPTVTSQQSLELNIQKIINALCSPLPQENLKAKEYLKNHVELVPRVIHVLASQSREQEALYLRQEFAPLLRPNPVTSSLPNNMVSYRQPQPPRPQIIPSHHQPMVSSTHPYYPNMGQRGMPMYQGGPHPGHSPQLHHMLQRPPTIHQNPYAAAYSMGGVHPPPQYQHMTPRLNMHGYPQKMMSPQSVVNPAMMRPMGMHPATNVPPMLNQMTQHQQQMRLAMHQYRPGPPTMADSPHLSADPNMLNYQYSANTNANNSNILMSSSQQQQYHQHQFNSKPPNYPHL